jgi:hypothetical protein
VTRLRIDLRHGRDMRKEVPLVNKLCGNIRLSDVASILREYNVTKLGHPSGTVW